MAFGIGKKNDKIWLYTEPGNNQPPVILLNDVPLYIKLSVKTDGTREGLFNASAPLEMKLGELFNHFINLNKRKLTIDMVDDKQKSYSWKFYTKGLVIRRQLDPALSLHKNKIKEMAVIIARRLS